MICTISDAIPRHLGLDRRRSRAKARVRPRPRGINHRHDPKTSDVMPLFWTIDSKARMFAAEAEGPVTLAEALELLETMAGAFCVKIRSYHDHPDLGAVAVVGTDEQTMIFSRLLGALAAGNRPFKIFATLRQARHWLALLDREPPPA